MRKSDIRVGNLVCDPSNYNYEFRAGVNEIDCAEIFSPVSLAKHHLKSFDCECLDSKTIYYKNDDGKVISLENKGGQWNLNIRTNERRFEGVVKYVHELQNIASDCGIYLSL